MDDAIRNQLMRLAIDEGKKSISEGGKLTPKVGAVLYKNGELLGCAYRGQMGHGDHAEYTLFEKVLSGKDVSGATLFTTLEPCTSRNKHKPCSDWVIEKGIKRVIIGYLDPNPKIYTVGCTKLKNAGIDVEYFPKDLRLEIENDNKSFIEQYKASPALNGTVNFDYTKNGGLFTIGNGDLLFNTKWSKGDNRQIWAYTNNHKAIAIAEGNKDIADIVDGSIYHHNTSPNVCVPLGKILILENLNGYFAAIKILGIKDKSRPHNDIDELSFEYKIQENKSANFTF